MTKKKTTKVRNKYSVLCQKRAKLIDACVFVTQHNVWAIVKGKEYLDGRFKYVYNGVEAIAEPHKCIPARPDGGLTRAFLKTEAVRMNMQLIEQQRPKKKKLKARWVANNLMNEILVDLAPNNPPPVVEAEPNV